MRTVSHEELKSVQLEILDVLDSFCREHGLRYSLSNGTLIGAVRHGGFIPWDDDIDVTMPRADYERLLKEFPEVWNGHYRLGAPERTPGWDRFYAKLYDDRTVMEENRRDAVETGINVDIFPADAVPEDESQWNAWLRRRLRLHRLFELKDRKLSSPRAWWKTALLVPVKLVLLPVGKKRLCRLAEEEAKRWNSTASGKKLCSLVNGYHLTQPYKAEIFDSLEEISFEGHRCLRFLNFDEYLRAGYGNYMKMPPENRRVSHHCFTAYYKD